MKTLVIEREAVKNNIGVIKERAGEAVIYAVLTGDGQGAGLVELARLLREEGIGRFAVSEPAEAAARRAQEHGMKKVDVFVKGPGSGRETAIRSLQAAGLEVGSITDVTPQAFNGCRPPKRRRV